MEVFFSAKKNSSLKSSTELDSVMQELPILPFRNNFKNFTWSLRPSDSLPPVSPPLPPISPSLPSHFFNCISDGAVNHISPAQFLAYLQQAAMTFSLLLLSQASKDVSYTKPNHWFLRISFDICEITFLSTLLHQTKAPNRNRRGVQAKKHLCYGLQTKPIHSEKTV